VTRTGTAAPPLPTPDTPPPREGELDSPAPVGPSAPAAAAPANAPHSLGTSDSAATRESQPAAPTDTRTDDQH